MFQPLRVVSVLAFVALLGACAGGPQRVVLFPGAEAPPVAAQGMQVALTVVDQVVVPKVGAGEVPGIMVSDPAQVVRATVGGALAKAGFVTAPVAAPQLTVILHELTYTTPTTVMQGTVRTRVTVEAVAKAADGTIFRRTYRQAEERQIALVPFARKDGTLLNRALTDVLTRMLADPGLLAALGASIP